ncbi:MAG: hypothetical protein LBV16_08520 [Elusimicrobiota bacterium]|jgi:hypothetical protein|nr:hypothetical protein [Elusimicrobiota bacterium]
MSLLIQGDCGSSPQLTALTEVEGNSEIACNDEVECGDRAICGESGFPIATFGNDDKKKQ